jgi:hypothetical protein
MSERHACALRLDQHVEDLTLTLDGPSKVDHVAVDFQIDLGRLGLIRQTPSPSQE